MDHAFGIKHNFLPTLYPEKFSPKSCIDLCCTVKSMIYFELFFCTRYEFRSRFIFLAAGCLIALATLVKQALSPTLTCFLHFCQGYLCGSISEFSVWFHWYVCLFLLPYYFHSSILLYFHSLNYCSYIKNLEIRETDSFHVIFLFQNCFCYFNVFVYQF